ncbi:P44/Msp2 family outer membrane protein [Anaplasma ovis str. Haibei]|uniref:P44/Msp2 family outer membrane protein n=1 Tax=Anaplasma ovis str. Haibei TaxID=1248439 RepID=A0A2Z2LGT2_9RICK|nr:outer membrane protein MSP2 [Anaplasma ovis]ASI47989.1 P44/Msp2 family outer membrane protein [Anaplasma ovis str. Haibei]
MSAVSYRKLPLGGVLMALVAAVAPVHSLLAAPTAGAGTGGEGLFSGAGAGSFYIGLDYSPAFGSIKDFKVQEAGGTTRGVFPYKRDTTGRVDFKVHNFDWGAPEPKISFKDSMLTALEGSIGYSIGGARVEVEVGYERFVIKGGKKSNEDTASVFLLGKELAYDTARGQVDRLANALGKMTKSEAKKWGTAVEGATGGDALSRKVCGTANSGSGSNCGTTGSNGNGKLSTAFTEDTTTLLSAADTTINTAGMATNINGLTKDEKAIVAGAFARAVEGAEVIEVRAIGSTSVMLNACYDLLTDGIGVVPYACAGVGGNFVSVVDGHINPKFAYRVKAGLSYALTPEISAFAGAFYHKVLGDGDYDELPLSPIADYTGPAGKNKDTGIASFTFAYFGGELGVRFAF